MDIGGTLNALPLLGPVFQLLGYLLANLPVEARTAISYSVPITFAALCGVMCERSGVVNIGLEGMILIAAFVGWFVGAIAASTLGPGQPSSLPFGITVPLLIGLVAALGSGLVIALLHAWLSISMRVDQIISGTIINIAAVGITGYMYRLISPLSLVGGGNLQPVGIPDSVAHVWGVGWLIDAILGQGPIGLTMLVMVILMQIMLFRSRWGLRTRAAGEHPRAAETAGVNVIWLRYRNVILSGALAALGGAWLSMEHGNTFTQGMSAGYGFIGLAAMIVGRWTPVGAFLAALLFASARAVQYSIQIAPRGEAGPIVQAIPPQFFEALPYVITIIVLAGLIGRSVSPAADGQPYERESAT